MINSNLILDAKKEEVSNRRKMLHNIYCKKEDLQPYDNKAFLKLLNEVNKQIESNKS